MMKAWWMVVVAVLMTGARLATAAEVVVAEGEFFKPQGPGWSVTHMDDSYASHGYGGMWLTQGGCLGAPADSMNAVAVQTVSVPVAGSYRVWSKYQSPPYFNYLHKIELFQNGKKLYEHVYGKKGTDRLWSFSGVSDELWWFWGVDHDAAEAPKTVAQLAAGPAEIRVTAVANPMPAGCRFIDFVVLTTEPGDTYVGFKPYTVASPFTVEALARTQVYLRFKNNSPAPAKLKLRTPTGHYQPNYGPRETAIPENADVAPGQWSPWVNIGPFCRLVHDEGIDVSLANASGPIEIEAARDAAGKEPAGAVKLPNGETFMVPLDIAWNKSRTIFASQARAEELTRLAKKEWRTRNNGRKPQSILYYGAFNEMERPWVAAFKDALGYNTLLPDAYAHAPIDGYHQHCHSPDELKAYVSKLSDAQKKTFKVMSFGDEISLGEINWADPAMQTKFTAWLKTRGVTSADLGGMNPDAAKLADRAANRRVGWYAQTFNEEERFGSFRDLTAQAKALLGPQVETGANYSPHPMPMYYGPIYQWIDIFKHNGMTMYWAEDYVFSVPMPPQMISWMLSTVRCAVKYNKQKIHFYVMPHAPGQRADFLRRSMIYAPGAGVNHIDNFWVAPPETFTENSVAWGYTDTFRTIHESIYDTAEAEALLAGGAVRPGRVAVLLSKATDHNERLAKVPKAEDAIMANCKNADATVQQTLGRVEAQMLYLALLHGQHRVDLITEDDIALDNILSKYDVVHVAGEWIDHRVPAKLEAWVKNGGILYASGGLGVRNEFDEVDPAFLKLLGLKSVDHTAKNLAVIRATLELPVAPPIGTIAFDGATIPAVGLKQTLTPADATVLGKWADGKPAVTVRELGKGKAFAVGTLAGCAYMKTGLPVQPFARGGNRCPVTPTTFDPAAAKLARLGVDAKVIEEPAVCSNPFVEALVMDGPKGSVLTLANWTDKPVTNLQVAVRLSAKPKEARSVQAGKALPAEFKDGILTLTTDLEWADYILLSK